MNRDEVKDLLKTREEELKKYSESQIKANNANNSLETINIYKRDCYNKDILINDIDKQLLNYVKESPVGEWLLKIKGITPDLAAGLLAYFDIRNKECATQFIRYSGADNCNKPHNNDVRYIINKISDNFATEPDSYYYKIYKEKLIELINNKIDLNIACLRAGRYMRKTFVSHVFEEMYREAHNGEEPIRSITDAINIEPEIPYTK